MRLNPGVRIDLVLSEKLIDITGEGFDLAIRSVDVPKTSSLYSNVIGSHTKNLVASPDYLNKITLPERPEQLGTLNLLNYYGQQSPTYWKFYQSDSKYKHQPESVFSSNNYYTLLTAAKNGLGVANLYDYMVDEDIRAGNLVRLLPDWHQEARSRFAIYQQRRDLSPKLDSFLLFLEELFQEK